MFAYSSMHLRVVVCPLTFVRTTKGADGEVKYDTRGPMNHFKTAA